jgi:Fe-S cluster biogenesis protein NfuA
MCSGCAGAAGTLKHVIEKALQEKVDPSLTVEQA